MPLSSTEMDDFIHWDDSDIDLDSLLGDFTDHDVAVHDLSDDIWSDSDGLASVHSESSPKRKKKKLPAKENAIVEYGCPLCQKTYKSIVGFRGHVTKKHDRSDLKAHDHRLNKLSSPAPSGKPLPQQDCGLASITTQPHIQEALQVIVPKAIACVIQDPMMDESCSVNGPSLVLIAKDITSSKNINDKLVSLLSPRLHSVFLRFGHGSSLAADRETLWHNFHSLRTDRDFVTELRTSIQQCTKESVEMTHVFVQCLLQRTVRLLLEHYCETLSSGAEKQSTEIGDNDQSVLFYISGYLVHSATKKNLCSDQLTTLQTYTDSKEGFIKKFSDWTTKINRGGLKLPSDNFFLLVRSMETVVRSEVNVTKLTSTSLQCDKLKENILTNFMVKYYWDKLVETDGSELQLLEYFVNLFLRIRGAAVVKFTKKQLQKQKKKEKKSKNSHSLRKTLKSIDNVN